MQYALDFRINIIKQLYSKIKDFQNRYVDFFNDKLTNDLENNEQILRSVYGGQQFHIKTRDEMYTKLNNVYGDINNNYMTDLNVQSQMVNSSLIKPKFITSSQPIELIEVKENVCLYARTCDDSCNIPLKWASTIYNNFKILAPCYNLKQMQNNIIEFEKCYNCYDMYTNKQNQQCLNCFDNIKLINSISNHYQHLRTISRKIYSIRNLNILIIDLDNYLLKESIGLIENIISFKKEIIKSDTVISRSNHAINYDIKYFDSLNEKFQIDLIKKLTMFECISCNRLFTTDKLKLFNVNDLDNSIINQLISDSKFDKDLYICRDQCLKDINNLKIPIYSKLNNMNLQYPPKEIACLNFYEKLLIQKAKCFQTIVQLKSLRNSQNSQKVFALKGLAIHLPISFETTHEYIVETLPNSDALSIIVHGLPTKNKNIWRGIVNLEAVYKALIWLKKNNVHYKSIHIDETLINNFNLNIIDSNDSSDQINNCTESYLTTNSNNFNIDTISHFTIIDLEKINVNISDVQKYSVKKVVSTPLTDRDKNLDHLCFVDIFPYGRGGMYDDRTSRVQPAMYIKWLLRNSNPIARRNIQFLFSAIHNKDVRAIDSGIFASIRTSSMPNLNAQILKDKIKKNDRQLEANLSTTLSAVRGSKQYWSTKCSDLKLFDEKFGPATFFLTLASAEYNWLNLHQFLINQNNDLDNIDSTSLNQLISIDPVSTSIFFEKKFRSFLNNVLLAKNSPLGEIEHYFWRREYQARGAPHIHSKFWVKNAPIYGVDSDEVVMDYIEKHITCRIPDPIKEPILYDKVMKYQVHRCTSSCQRLVFNKGKKSLICRYGFPRPVQSKITLNTIEATLKSRQKGRSPIKLYNLARTYEERFINDYNPILLLLWDANIDIQFIHESSRSLDNYLTSNITKSEKNSNEEAWDACNKNKSLQSNLKSFALKSFQNREMGIFEVADKLLGYSLYEFSDQIKWLNSQPYNQRNRRIKELNEIEKLNDDCQDIYHNNLIDDYYPNRPDSLESMCIYDLDSWFDFKSTKCHENCYKLKNNLGYLHKRSKPKVIKTQNIKLIDNETYEKYAHQVLFLFKPWRNEKADLISTFNSYLEAFEYSQKNNELDSKLFTEFQEQKIKLQLTIEKIKENKEKVEQQGDLQNTFNDSNLSSSQQNIYNANDLINLGALDLFNDEIDISKLEANINMLNSEQNEIYHEVIDKINHQEMHNKNLCSCSDGNQPIRLFCSGVAG